MGQILGRRRVLAGGVLALRGEPAVAVVVKQAAGQRRAPASDSVHAPSRRRRQSMPRRQGCRGGRAPRIGCSAAPLESMTGSRSAAPTSTRSPGSRRAASPLARGRASGASARATLRARATPRALARATTSAWSRRRHPRPAGSPGGHVSQRRRASQRRRGQREIARSNTAAQMQTTNGTTISNLTAASDQDAFSSPQRRVISRTAVTPSHPATEILRVTSCHSRDTRDGAPPLATWTDGRRRPNSGWSRARHRVRRRSEDKIIPSPDDRLARGVDDLAHEPDRASEAASAWTLWCRSTM